MTDTTLVRPESPIDANYIANALADRRLRRLHTISSRSVARRSRRVGPGTRS
jgi:hypothetical protein